MSSNSRRSQQYAPFNKMDRIFTQSGQPVPPRYLRNGRGGYPTHFRTVSGSGGVDEWDYAPAPVVGYRYGDRRRRGPLRHPGFDPRDTRRYTQAPRRPNGRKPMYEEAIRQPRYHRDSMRRSPSDRQYRNSERYYSYDEMSPPHSPQQQNRKPTNRRRRRSKPHSVTEVHENRPEVRRRPSRRRRTTSGEPSTAVVANQPKAKPNKRFACNQCKMAFGTDQLRIRHTRLLHPRRRDFVCKECRGVFVSAKSITMHLSQKPHLMHQEVSDNRQKPALGVPVRYLAEGVAVFQCRFCPFGFVSASDAESHQGRCRASQRLTVNLSVEYPGNSQYNMFCFCCPELLELRHGFREHFDCLHGHVDLNITFHCALCPKKFDEEDMARKHFDAIHSNSEMEELHVHRKEQFIEDSLKSYQTKRPVSVVRIKADVRKVMGKVLRLVTNSVKQSAQSPQLN